MEQENLWRGIPGKFGKLERVWASKEGREGYGVSLQKTIRKGEKL